MKARLLNSLLTLFCGRGTGGEGRQPRRWPTPRTCGRTRKGQRSPHCGVRSSGGAAAPTAKRGTGGSRATAASPRSATGPAQQPPTPPPPPPQGSWAFCPRGCFRHGGPACARAAARAAAAAWPRARSQAASPGNGWLVRPFPPSAPLPWWMANPPRPTPTRRPPPPPPPCRRGQRRVAVARYRVRPSQAAPTDTGGASVSRFAIHGAHSTGGQWVRQQRLCSSPCGSPFQVLSKLAHSGRLAGGARTQEHGRRTVGCVLPAARCVTPLAARRVVGEQKQVQRLFFMIVLAFEGGPASPRRPRGGRETLMDMQPPHAPPTSAPLPRGPLCGMPS